MKCAICGNEIKGYGNSGFPASSGTVCDKCNSNVVVPYRVFLNNIKNQNTALLITPTELRLVNPKNKYFTLKELQSAVDGYIELVGSDFSKHVEVINEEGRILGLAFNNLANLVLQKEYYGNVLIVPLKIFEEPSE